MCHLSRVSFPPSLRSPAMLMCVRKPGDPAPSSSSVLQSHHRAPPAPATATSTVQIKTRKSKTSLKVLKRSTKADPERPVDANYQLPASSARLPPASPSTSSSCSGRVVATTAAKVRDDFEGHLIYGRGDRLDTRCTGGWEEKREGGRTGYREDGSCLVAGCVQRVRVASTS